MAIYVDHEQVTKAQLFERLRIPAKSVPLPKRKVFQFENKSDSDGNIRFRRRIVGGSEFNVFVQELGKDVNIRYAVTQKKDKDQNFVYTPNDIALEAGERGEVLMNDELAYIWWYLRPMNKQSPFRKSEQPFYYEFQDNDGTATAENDKDELRITAMSIVLGPTSWTVKKLRVLAKGMGINGVDDLTDEVVKKQLKGLAFNDPDTFLNKAESREIIFNGKVQEAIDRNIITLRTLNGMSRWYINGKEIIPIQYGADARTVLNDHLSEKYYLYSDEINGSLDNKNVSTNLNNAQNDAAFQDDEPETINKIADADYDLLKQFDELKADQAKFDKVAKWAEMDLSNPGIHFMTRKAIEENQELINLYKKGIQLETA